MARLRRFVVSGPERSHIEPLVDGDGPLTMERNAYLIDAPSRYLAKWAAYRLARHLGDAWASGLSGEHPLSGVLVEPAADEEDPAAWGARFYAYGSGGLR